MRIGRNRTRVRKDDMKDKDDNLIEVQRWKVADLPLVVHRNDDPYCRHLHTEVDDNKRTVTCRDCKASLDELKAEERRVKERLKRARARLGEA